MTAQRKVNNNVRSSASEQAQVAPIANAGVNSHLDCQGVNSHLATLAESANVGKSARESVLATRRAHGAITSHLERLNAIASEQLANGVAVATIKGELTAHLEAMLLAASRQKGGALDGDDDAGKLARKMLWDNIKQTISKKGFFVIAGERPQAKQGANHLVQWGVAQRGKHVADDTGADVTAPDTDTTPDTTPEVVAIEQVNPLAAFTDEQLFEELKRRGYDVVTG